MYSIVVLEEPCCIMHKYLCIPCRYETNHKAHFKYHRKTIKHCYNMKYSCMPCRYASNSKRNFKRHKTAKRHLLQTSVDHQRKNMKHFMKEVKCHTESNVRQQQEGENMKQYEQQHNLLKEKEQAHNLLNIKPFKCNQCSFSTLYKQCLERHLKNKHSSTMEKIKPFKCNQCSYNTHYNQCLKSHQKQNHRLEYLKNKLHIHWLEYELDLNLQHLKNEINKSLKSHEKECLKSSFLCSICMKDNVDRYFKSKEELKNHIRLKHQRKSRVVPRKKKYT